MLMPQPFYTGIVHDAGDVSDTDSDLVLVVTCGCSHVLNGCVVRSGCDVNVQRDSNGAVKGINSACSGARVRFA